MYIITVTPVRFSFHFFIPFFLYIFFHLFIVFLNTFSFSGLPEIPTDILITEGRRKRSIYLEWDSSAKKLVPDSSNVLYAVEERHYTGRHFIESRMSDWTICFRSPKPSHILRHFVKPGRWYQFRVAAVNENGTRGFSPPSVRFSISAGK